MNDDSTRVLDQQPKLTDETQELPRAAVPPPGPPQQAPKQSKHIVLRILWALARLWVVLASLLLLAQAIGQFIAAPLGQWLAAIAVGVLVPMALYLWIRKVLKRRSPNARVKLSAITWSFGWNLVVFLVLWLNMPGVGTQAIGVQGANLARGVTRVVEPGTALPNSVIWVADISSRLSLALESAIFGNDAVEARANAGRNALTQGTSPAAGTEGATAGTATGAGGAGTAAGTQAGGEGTTGSSPVQPLPVVGGQQPSGTSTGQGAASGPLPSPADAGTGNGLPSEAVPQPGTTSVAAKGAVPVPLPAGSSTQAAPESASGRSVEIPYEQEAASILVDVVINRLYPVRLALDSTSAYTTIDGDTLKRMNITPAAGAPTATINTNFGPQTDALITVETLAIGGLELSGPTIMRCNECRGLSFKGILGRNVLSNFGVSVDNATSMVRLEDRRASFDQREDIRPYVSLEATPEASAGPVQPFVVSATSRAPRAIQVLFARLTLLDQNRQTVSAQDIRLPSLPAGQKVTVKADVPRQPPFTYFAVELGEARW